MQVQTNYDRQIYEVATSNEPKPKSWKQIVQENDFFPAQFITLCELLSTEPQFSTEHSFYQKAGITDPPLKFISFTEKYASIVNESESTFIVSACEKLCESTSFQKFDNGIFLGSFKHLLFFTDSERTSFIVINQFHPQTKVNYDLSSILKDDPLVKQLVLTEHYILECISKDEDTVAIIARGCYVILLNLKEKKGEIIHTWNLDEKNFKISEIKAVFKLKDFLWVQIRKYQFEDYANNYTFSYAQKISTIFDKSKPNIATQFLPFDKETFSQNNYVYFKTAFGFECYNSQGQLMMRIFSSAQKILFGNFFWTIIDTINYFNKKTNSLKSIYKKGALHCTSDLTNCCLRIYENIILIYANIESLSIYIKLLDKKHDVVQVDTLNSLFKSKNIPIKDLYIKDIVFENNLCYCLINNNIAHQYYVVKFHIDSLKKDIKID